MIFVFDLLAISECSGHKRRSKCPGQFCRAEAGKFSRAHKIPVLRRLPRADDADPICPGGPGGRVAWLDPGKVLSVAIVPFP
jgi:hypothetical protein